MQVGGHPGYGLRLHLNYICLPCLLLMFLIFVNELIDIIQKFGVKVKMFSDDVKVYLLSTDDIDVAQLQQVVYAFIIIIMVYFRQKPIEHKKNQLG